MESPKNRKKIQQIIKIRKNNNYDVDIEKIFEKDGKDSLKQFFIDLNEEIIKELKNINNIIIQDINSLNPFLINDKKFLFEMIELYILLIEKNKEDINPKDIIGSIIISVSYLNQYNFSTFEINTINYYNTILALLTKIMEKKPQFLLDYLILYEDNDLNKLFLIFSYNQTSRKFLYECIQTIFLLFPRDIKYNNLIKSINIIINYLNQGLTNESFMVIIEEIQPLLYYFQNNINIISNSMLQLLVKLFKLIESGNDKENGKNIIISTFLRHCLDRIVFFYSNDNSNNYNNNNNIITDNNNNYKYNKEFMNFLLDIYNELTNQKLKYSYTSFLMELFLGNNNIGIGTQKYIWLINNTKFAEVVLQSLIDLKDYNLLSLYFSKIFFLSLPNSNDNDNDYIPEFDIKYFFDRLELIINSKNEEDNEKLFDVISSQIINLINYKNINKSNSGNVIIDVILKYSIPNKILSIVNSKKYAKNIQYKLINFLDNILILTINIL